MRIQGFTPEDWDRYENYNDGPGPLPRCDCPDCRSEGRWSYEHDVSYHPDCRFRPRRSDADAS